MDKNIFEQKRSDYRRFGFTLLYLSVFLYLGVLIPGISDTAVKLYSLMGMTMVLLIASFTFFKKAIAYQKRIMEEE